MLKSILTKLFSHETYPSLNEGYKFRLRENKYKSRSLIVFLVLYRDKPIDRMCFSIVQNGQNIIGYYNKYGIYNKHINSEIPNYVNNLEDKYIVNTVNVLDLFYSEGVEI